MPGLSQRIGRFDWRLVAQVPGPPLVVLEPIFKGQLCLGLVQGCSRCHKAYMFIMFLMLSPLGFTEAAAGVSSSGWQNGMIRRSL